VEIEQRSTWVKKLATPHLNKPGVIAHVCNPAYAGSMGKRPALGKNVRSYLKNK
jgi:hypothetical protein